MTQRRTPNLGYGSADDLPTIVELRQQIAGARLLTMFIGRNHRQQFIDIERQIDEMTRRVDAFYDLLGDRYWVYPDYLPSDELDQLATLSVDDAEKALIELHKSLDTLQRIDLRLRGHAALRCRLHIIRRAADNYSAGRYMECVHLLLSVMDGFVADVDEARHRGLHARDSVDMVAWDSVVGHHKGLAHAHTIFRKGTNRTTDGQLVNLQRHGIVHGRQLDFDNDIVATKAWNQLLALRDWAKSLELAARPPEPNPTMRDVFGTIQRNAANKQSLAQWRSSTLTPLDLGFADDPVVGTTTTYLTDWQRCRYGPMAEQLTSMFLMGNDGKRAGQVRSEYETFPLSAFEITEVDHRAASRCDVHVRLTISGDTQVGMLAWLREGADGKIALPADEGKWKLTSWGPYAILKNRAA